MKFATLYSGGEGAGIGAAQAGADHLWGIEYESAIADVARANGFHAITADTRTVDYADLARPEWIHGSPPCVRASVANQETESDEDMALALAFVAAVEAHMPRRISVENVRGYMHFAAYKELKRRVQSLGYLIVESVFNAADYGTPQTRERLFLIGSLDGIPNIPKPTHTKKTADADQASMFNPLLPRWNGWYAAIADLIPELPDSELAPWQVKRFEASGITTAAMFSSTGENQEYGDGLRPGEQPALTVRSDPRLRAVMFNSENAGQEWGKGYKDENDPSFTLTSQMSGPRAVLIHPTEQRTMTIRDDRDPSFTVMAQKDSGSFSPRAVFFDQHGNPLIYTCKKIAPIALARFNGLVNYLLPSSNRIAGRVIGNMVCPSVMRAIIEANPL